MLSKFSRNQKINLDSLVSTNVFLHLKSPTKTTNEQRRLGSPIKMEMWIIGLIRIIVASKKEKRMIVASGKIQFFMKKKSESDSIYRQDCSY